MATFINVQVLSEYIKRFICENKKSYGVTEQLVTDAIFVSLREDMPHELQFATFDCVDDARNEYGNDGLIEGIEADILLSLTIKGDAVEVEETDVYGTDDEDVDFFANVEIRKIDGVEDAVTVRLTDIEEKN